MPTSMNSLNGTSIATNWKWSNLVNGTVMRKTRLSESGAALIKLDIGFENDTMEIVMVGDCDVTTSNIDALMTERDSGVTCIHNNNLSGLTARPICRFHKQREVNMI